MMLAELGARVIKVEEPSSGDDSRCFAPMHKGKSAYFLSLNREKESIALDLKNDEDRAVLLDLVRRADVVVENFRPGTLDRLGLGYEHLREVNGGLIYAAVSGFGDSGPMRTKPAYDMIVQAMSGMMTITGQPGSPPTKAGTSDRRHYRRTVSAGGDHHRALSSAADGRGTQGRRQHARRPNRHP